MQTNIVNLKDFKSKSYKENEEIMVLENSDIVIDHNNEETKSHKK